MPIRIQNDLPAKEILEKENIFVMDETRALSQEIRPLKVGILNLMPLKEDTGTSVIKKFFQYTAAGGCDFYYGENP